MAKSRYADATKAARRAAMSAHKVTAAANAGNADASAQPTASAATEPARDARRDELTHVDAKGEVRMVDVSDKAETHRIAIAAGTILMHTRGGHHGHQAHERHHSHVPSVAHYQEQVRYCAHRPGGDACR